MVPGPRTRQGFVEVWRGLLSVAPSVAVPRTHQTIRGKRRPVRRPLAVPRAVAAMGALCVPWSPRQKSSLEVIVRLAVALADSV